jgi:uncharacterized protein (TIGR04255 family)
MCTTLCTVEGRPPILRNSPLQIVAVELRFPEAVLLPEDLKNIRRGLAELYPASGTEHGLGIQLTPEGAVRQQEKTQRQVYRTTDGAHQIGLTSTTLVLEARGPRYEGFEHFLNRWLTALDVVVPVAEISLQQRVGLRYVNQLPIEDVTPGVAVLDRRVNPALLSPMGADGFGFRVATSFEELRLQNEYGKATLRHGLQVGPEGTIPPGIYLLDIDFYDDQFVSFDRERHLEQLKLFNRQVWEIFRWSLTNPEYERMQPEERQ